MNKMIDCGLLYNYIITNYNIKHINNTDFIVNLYLKLKLDCHIKSVIKQGWVNGKSILYLQIKNKIDIIHIYYLEEQLYIVSIKESDIKESRYK